MEQATHTLGSYSINNGIETAVNDPETLLYVDVYNFGDKSMVELFVKRDGKTKSFDALEIVHDDNYFDNIPNYMVEVGEILDSLEMDDQIIIGAFLQVALNTFLYRDRL